MKPLRRESGPRAHRERILRLRALVARGRRSAGALYRTGGTEHLENVLQLCPHRSTARHPNALRGQIRAGCRHNRVRTPARDYPEHAMDVSILFTEHQKRMYFLTRAGSPGETSCVA